MSVSSHNGPIRRLQRDDSHRSLYSDNSNNSDYPNSPKYKPIQRAQQQTISHRINNLPGASQEKLRSPFHQPKRDPNDIPTFPKIKAVENQSGQKKHHSPSGPGIKFNSHPLANQMKTIGVTNNIDSRFGSNAEMDANHPYRMSGMSGISGIQHVSSNDRSRMLRSSQGGRWFRSQSLMQEKEKKSSELLIKNFHRNGSKYSQQLEEFLKYFSAVEKNISSKPAFNHKISVHDSLEEMKNKMESFLQTKIDLSLLPIDRPDADWGQSELMKFYQNYQQILTEKPETPKGEQNNPAFTQTVLKKYKNCSYFGPIKEGKKNGFGFLHYFSGRFFEGLFLSDFKIEGFQMDDSELYIGSYKKNQRHGNGILKTNESLLTGVFTNGQFGYEQSEGDDQNPNSSKGNENPIPVFTGQKENKQSKIFKSGFKIAFSSVTFYHGPSMVVQKSNSGDIYIGEMNEEGEKQGEGLQIFANGDLYIGKYEQGAPEGYGEYYWDSGAFYRGEFLSGMRHGRGVWMMVNGDRYEGDYLNDKKNGRGEYIWKTGDKYTGEFQNDYRHGFGEMSWRDGASYKGKWLNGIQANKVFKLEGDNNTISVKNSPRSRVLPSVTKNSFKTVEHKKRTGNASLNNGLNKSHNKTGGLAKNGNSRYSQYHRVESSKVKNQRVPLQKLKAMLNPSNSIN